MVSSQQGAFIKGRNIHEKIVLSSELVNELDIKRRGGNVVLKIDITQAYDSLSWKFLFEVLRRFGFSEMGINWCLRVKTVSADFGCMVLVNGGPCGFFGVGRSLRQGDPLSPILFVLAEVVLSRNITKLVQMGKMQSMVNRGGYQPTHLMFSDDIFIFCNGQKKNLKNLMDLLMKYQKSSVQEMNKAKRKCFVGGVPNIIRNAIAQALQIHLSTFSDKYLGVILNPGRVKTHQVWWMVEMMQKMLAGWMGKLLAFSARLTLVKFVLCSMPIYTMPVYKWPKSVIQVCERIIRNFLWSGDPAVKKLVNVKWDTVNAPVEEGGLGLRRLEAMNKALLMKLLRNIETEDEEWTNFMIAKFKNKKGEWIEYYKQSSIWPDINLAWLVGDGKIISVWKDKWVKNYPLIERHHGDAYITQNCDMKVQDLIQDGEWRIPEKMLQYFELNELPVMGSGKDRRIWTNDLAGIFTVAKAAQSVRNHYPKESWTQQVWQPCIHPYTSTNLWKILKGACETEEAVRKKGFSTVSKCYLCGNNNDTLQHILWACDFRSRIWHWLGGVSQCASPSNLDEILKNAVIYESIQPNVGQFKQKIIRYTKECRVRTKAQDQILICCDGASKGNPGKYVSGFIARTSIGDCIGAALAGLGIAINYLAGSYHGRWDKIKQSITSISFRYLYRETNFSADKMAKKGVLLNRGEVIYYDEKPSFLGALENEYGIYFRFS
ncbi:uncharacterized protein LOC113324313 [Papaver somniferum]|uniref:uncharacterized protein LOC113324313 n=1 Tax=Papaver somniferum TaxID=3469 RepID=UPI000E6F7EEC|nr:uncharacterized protein LOC113324313 [Papaver somniferum]